LTWVAGAFFGTAAASDAAFLQQEGSSQLISNSTVSGFSRDFDAKGRLVRSGTFSKTSLDVFAAHGLTSTITLVGAVSTDRLLPKFATDPGASTTWNAMAGVRAPLWQSDGGIISVQALAGAGSEMRGSGFIAEARLMAGRNLSIGTIPGFMDVQIAWRQNAPGARPELRLDATLGLKPDDRFMLLAQLFAAQGFAHAGQKQSLRVKAQFGVVWHVGETWSVQASAFHTVYGRDTGQEAGATLGVWRRF
jgi:hypothetical protein